MESLSIRKNGNFFQRGLSRLYATVVFVLIGLGASLSAQATTYSTTTTVQINNYAPLSGKPYTLLAYVQNIGGVIGPTPSLKGDVYFYDNGTFIGKALAGYPSRLTYTFNTYGSHTIVAIYQGDNGNGYSYAPSPSVPLQLNVLNGGGGCIGPC
ncbi:Ig-like domain-containing protein [Neisseriaceae bacterium TC5R-5]|nr:Ig-like domain-containing protein [Neisseriaceae bacterium TC5R-5]